jgi:hypothetical protein
MTGQGVTEGGLPGHCQASYMPTDIFIKTTRHESEHNPLFEGDFAFYFISRPFIKEEAGCNRWRLEGDENQNLKLVGLVNS